MFVVLLSGLLCVVAVVRVFLRLLFGVWNHDFECFCCLRFVLDFFVVVRVLLLVGVV